jgi:hypothetical protein
MIRNLKVLIAAAMVLGAFGAFNASGAQAAEFHCSVEPCTATLKPDGAVPSKQAHHVYVIKNAIGESVTITCEQITGQATLNTKTATTVTVTNIIYDKCLDPVGNKATVHMNTCDYTFTSHGKVGVNCPAGKIIQVTYGPLEACSVTVGTFSHREKITYKNLGIVPTREVTVEPKVANIPVTAVHGTTGNCLMDVTETPFTSEYTTGNTIVTAETHPGGVKVDGWWE